jgi:hypothetical protein
MRPSGLECAADAANLPHRIGTRFATVLRALPRSRAGASEPTSPLDDGGTFVVVIGYLRGAPFDRRIDELIEGPMP